MIKTSTLPTDLSNSCVVSLDSKNGEERCKHLIVQIKMSTI